MKPGRQHCRRSSSHTGHKDMKLVEEVNPVFICGLNRTGTTLLMALLDGHPQMVVAPSETHFFLHFLPAAQHLSHEKRIELARKMLLGVIDTENVYYKKFLCHVSVEWTLAMFLQISKSCHDIQEFLPASILAYGLASNQISDDTRYWVEKTPYNEFFVEQIFHFWPNAKCIHMVRDPRDYFASYKMRSHRKREHSPSSLIMSWEWLQSVQKANKNEKIYGTQRYLVLRYEDLVRNPEETIAVVCRFLAIERRPSLLVPTKGGGKVNWSGNAANGRAYQGIDSSILGRWTTTLTKREVLTIESATAKMMAVFGYDITWPKAFIFHKFLAPPFSVYRLWKQKRWGGLNA